MAKQAVNNIKLGIFVIAGLVILIATLYLIGRNQSLFGNNIAVRARFTNVGGLTKGNNVRFSGIQAGNVRDVRLIDDTTIEVTMLIDEKFQPFIHKNAMVVIGNEGLMGNKVINISTNKIPAAPIQDNDLLPTKKEKGTDAMLETLSNTNDNVAVISEDLKQTIRKLNNSAALWNLLNDSSIAYNLAVSLQQIRQAAVRVNEVAAGMNNIVADVQGGKGTVGTLLSDTGVAANLKNAVAHINEASSEADALIGRLDSLVQDVHDGLNDGNGTIYTLLKDTAAKTKLTNSLDNIEKGTAAFSEDMEALKHNFLTRRYFKKQEKAQNKEKKAERR
jgi:phospholipid/cholesterol/gamma-HCH transport system substrate-binding protein